MNMLDIDFEKVKTLNSTQRAKLKKMLEPRMNKYMAHYPMPKQAVFMNLTSKEAFYGGEKCCASI